MSIKDFRRWIGLAVTAVLLFTALAPNAATRSFAQDANSVSIDGSNIMSPVIKAAVQAYTGKNPDAKISVNVSGTGGGFDKLCSGSLDVAMAVSAITDAEIAACKQKNVDFVEIDLGYDALVVIVNRASKVACLTTDQLNKTFGPGSTTKNWKDIDSTLGDLPISAIYAPAADSQTYLLADSIIAGDKLRPDIQSLEPAAKNTPPSVAAKVGGEPNAIGLMNLTDYNAAKVGSATVKSVQLNGGSGCTDPTVPDLEEGRYLGGETLYLYVNAASLDRKPVADFLNYLLNDGRSAVTDNGFTAADDPIYARDQHYLSLKQTGRTFSLVQSVNIPAQTAGTIEVDGSPDLFTPLKAINDAFSPRYANIKLDNVEYGNDTGYQRICTNNIDLMGATRLPTDAEVSACKKASVDLLTLSLGSNAVVLVANNDNKAAACLTTDQVATIFGVTSEKKVMKWSDVSADFPSTDLMVLTPTDGAPETDLLLNAVMPKQVAPIRRKDTVDNDDALYRAAAVHNVPGAITYMNFSDYKRITAQVHTVQINAGKGCVDPTEANIKNGTYTLARPLYLILNEGTFSRPDIKAFVWYLLGDESLALLAKQGLVGTDTAAIIAARDTALQRFAQTPSGTPAATASAGTASSATAAATAATPAATTAPTSAATAAAPAATAAATLAPTSAATTAQ